MNLDLQQELLTGTVSQCLVVGPAYFVIGRIYRRVDTGVEASGSGLQSFFIVTGCRNPITAVSYKSCLEPFPTGLSMTWKYMMTHAFTEPPTLVRVLP